MSPLRADSCARKQNLYWRMTGDEERLEAWRLFLRAHALLVGSLDEDLDTHCHLSLAWYDVLTQLYSAPERRLRMSDLFHAVVISKSGLTRRIDRMVEAGLVARAGCPGDRRGVYAVLTDRGMQVLREAAPVHLAGVRALFLQHLTPDEAAAVTSALSKVVAGFVGEQPVSDVPT